MDTFSKLDIDPIEGAEIMRLVGITPDDLRDHHTFSKVREIMGFFQGKRDKSFVISKLLTGKHLDSKIDHVWSYANLRKQYAEAAQKVSEMEQLFKYLESDVKDESEKLGADRSVLVKQYSEVMQQVDTLKEQINHYER